MEKKKKREDRRIVCYFSSFTRSLHHRAQPRVTVWLRNTYIDDSGVIKGEKSESESGSVKTLKIMTRKRFVRMWPHAFCIRNGFFGRPALSLSPFVAQRSTENDQTIETYKFEKSQIRFSVECDGRCVGQWWWRRWNERKPELAKSDRENARKIMRE